MESLKEKKVLVSGASFAGLSTAYWMNKLGYNVTVIDIANELRKGGTPVDVRENTVDIVKRMGIFEQIKSNRLNLESWEFKNADDFTEGLMLLKNDDTQLPDNEFEIERDTLLNILFDAVKNDVDFIFNDSITALDETKNAINVTFKKGSQHTFGLVFGCDGVHSGVRKIWFGDEREHTHYLGGYFSVTIVNKSLIKQNTGQMYNVPGKAIMLNEYNNKTDIVFCFSSEKEIYYDYRDADQQRKIILEQFVGQRWRTEELLKEVMDSTTFYFDKLCQIRMPSWTKGRVALVGDAGYCASPAAGMGGSLAIDGAAALADAFQKYDGNFELAFQDYNKSFRPFIEEVQANAVRFGTEYLIPRTEEAIRKRNAQTVAF